MIVLVCLTGIMLALNLLLIVFWLTHFKRYHLPPTPGSDAEAAHAEFLPVPLSEPDGCPRVAILLAVRNEAHNLARCLDHLLAQDYPPDKLCLYVGNDASADDTLTIAQSYATRDSRIRVIDVQGTAGQARAKANVLAHLAQANASDQTPADFLLITDADISAPPGWIRGMLQSWQIASRKHCIGIVTGITLVQNNSLWAQLQRIDWVFALGMVKVVSDLGVPTATMGNNMLMTRQAYEATGGYEALPFSITEDFQILQEVTKRGFGFCNAVDQRVTVFTQPMPSFGELMQQRRRWTQGAIQLPLLMVGLLLLQALFYPLVMLLALIDMPAALLIFMGKTLLQSLFIWLVVEKLQLRGAVRLRMLACLLPYDLYAAVTTLSTVLYYFLPVKTIWKGRTF